MTDSIRGDAVRDLRRLSDDEFQRALEDFEQEDLERKRNLAFNTEEAKADFAVLVAGIGNAGGGTVVVGPFDSFTPSDEKRFDPALVSDLLNSVMSPRPAITVSRRQLGSKFFILIAVGPPRGMPFIVRRQVGKYPAGCVPHRVNTSTRVAVDSQELTQLWHRWLSPYAVQTDEDLRARYAGRSFDLSLLPGQSGTFAVFYLNTGKRPWRRESVDEAGLFTSRFEPERGYISPSPPSTAVARQQQSLVDSGQIATFIFNVQIPGGAKEGASHFLHPEVDGRQIGVDVPCIVHVLSMRVSGRVTDAASSAPLENVCVSVGIPGEWCWTTTDAAGHFVIDLEGIGAEAGGRWELLFTRPGYNIARSPAVRLPGNVHLSIAMTRNDGGAGRPPPAPVPTKVLHPAQGST